MEKETHKEIELSKIHPDENQPRKDFNAARLADLISSIKAHGILNPLVVEEHAGGQFMLVDGERRYRASKELGLRKVPVIIIPELAPQDRLIKQFHLQEQHEGWSATEKAVAIGQLSEEMKLTPVRMAKLLSIPERTIRDYVGFWNMMSREEFVQNEIPISYAGYITAARQRAKKIYESTFEKEFIQEKQQAVESQLIAQIKSGEVRVKTDITKLTDAFVQDPTTIEAFIKGRGTVTKLYLESNAKVARNVRNVRQQSQLIVSHINQIFKNDGMELLREDEQAIIAIKQLQPVLKNLIESI